ncbi:MAG: hypothetical protein ACKOC5_08890, partial [Chloroflexota bacterium]
MGAAVSPAAAPLAAIVFSRDRAMQLDALLRSFFLHRQDDAPLEISVLYAATTPAFAAQYRDLSRERWPGQAYARLHFVRQANFYRDVFRLLMGTCYTSLAPLYYRVTLQRRLGLQRWAGCWPLRSQAEIVLFLVDDSLFVRPFSLAQAAGCLRDHPDLLGFSLRLGRNTGYCYTRDRPQELPQFSELQPGIVHFDWTRAQGDFAYPLEVSSSVYRLADVLQSLQTKPFDNPNELEDAISAGAERFRAQRPRLACLELSAAFPGPVAAYRLHGIDRHREG